MVPALLVARRLAGAEARSRPGKHAALAGVVALAVAGALLTQGFVSGVRVSAGREISDSLSGDARIGLGDLTIADGDPLEDVTDAVARLEFRVPGARVAPRLEMPALLVRSDAQGTPRWDAALLVGIDPDRDANATRLREQVVAGAHVPDGFVFVEGERHVPLLVGRTLLEKTRLAVWDGNGTPPRESLLELTAGRLRGESHNGSLRIAPATLKAVVVGAYATGFRAVDRYVAFAPIATARSLAGQGAASDTATVLVASAPDPQRLLSEARALGYNATDAAAVRDGYLGPLLSTFDTFGATVSVLVLAITGLLVAHSVATLVADDRRRIAVLRAVGVPEGHVRLAFSLLGVGLGLAGALAGVALGAATAGALNAIDWRLPLLDVQLPLAVGPWMAAGLVGATLAVSGIGVLAGVWGLRGIRPRDANA